MLGAHITSLESDISPLLCLHSLKRIALKPYKKLTPKTEQKETKYGDCNCMHAYKYSKIFPYILTDNTPPSAVLLASSLHTTYYSFLHSFTLLSLSSLSNQRRKVHCWCNSLVDLFSYLLASTL